MRFSTYKFVKIRHYIRDKHKKLNRWSYIMILVTKENLDHIHYKTILTFAYV